MKFKDINRSNWKKLGLTFILLQASIISYVECQCRRTDDLPCAWMHDPESKVRWSVKTDTGYPYIEMTKCGKNCGTGALISPWLGPNDREMNVNLEYKTYGHQKVYLKLFMNYEDTSKPQKELLYVYGDYDKSFPNEWMPKTAVIPVSDQRFRLTLKASVPYNDAYVAVNGIVIGSPEVPDEFVDDNDIETELDQPEESRLSRGGFGPDNSVSTPRSVSLFILGVVLIDIHMFDVLKF